VLDWRECADNGQQSLKPLWHVAAILVRPREGYTPEAHREFASRQHINHLPGIGRGALRSNKRRNPTTPLIFC